MKLKWKKFKKIDFYIINKWIKKDSGIVRKTTSSILDEYKHLSKQNEYKIGDNLFIYKIHYHLKCVGIIVLVKAGLGLVINTLIINPKYDYLTYGKAVVNDLIKNNVMITKKLINQISVGITSDNHYALKLLKSLNFKLDNIHPDNNSFDFIYNL